MLALSWLVAALLGILFVAWLPWLVSRLAKSMVRSWRESDGGGYVLTPLEEIIQPQIRHVQQVHEQKRVEEDGGAPPAK